MSRRRKRRVVTGKADSSSESTRASSGQRRAYSMRRSHDRSESTRHEDPFFPLLLLFPCRHQSLPVEIDHVVWLSAWTNQSPWLSAVCARLAG
ncbi:hypothetical protein XA68_14068 [Ophiocordyceps unilateralis]|uniref:Uncharacterized protein n=1 Tax=Ophiocordyceps unilateralis TaxID=268505 RepID=A0A2A9PMQ8_OPHUN|nr:hypothetical protein XA68_14068 [Ophiocordyceps unilateralis]